jgi:hypothetical protein
LAENQKTIRNTFQSYLAKTGLPIDELTKLRASRQAELRSLFKARLAENAKGFPARESGFRESVDNRHEALRLLATPYQSTFVTLDQPFLIWQFPNPDFSIFVGSNTGPGSSFIKIKMDVQTPKHASYGRQCVFHFLWSNDSQFAAVINVRTSLVFNGVCEVYAAPGIFFGHHNTLTIGAHFDIIRWTGWGDVNQTLLPSLQPYQYVALLDVTGESIFGQRRHEIQEFDFQGFDFSRDLIVVPAGAVTMFKVTVDLSYTMSDPDELSDQIFFDFADDASGSRIICPSLVLELLTPLAGVNA